MPAVADRHGSRVWDDLTTLRSRFSFRFSPSGATAAALVADGRGAAYVEYWTFQPGHRCQPLLDTWTPASSVDQSGTPADPVPFDDGRVLLLRRHPGRHEVLVAHRDGGLRTLGVLEYPDVSVLPAPDGAGWALLVCRRADGQAGLWRLDTLDSAPRRIAGLPAAPLLVGGGFLDRAGRSYALNVRDGNRVKPVCVSSADGAVQVLSGQSTTTSRQVMLTAPATGRMVLAIESPGAWRLADADPGLDAEPRFAEPLDRVDADFVPLAIAPTGRHVLLHVQHGLRSDLLVYDLDGQAIRPLPTPDGAIGGPAAWTGTSIRCLFVSASEPFRVLTVNPDRPGRWTKHDDGTTGNVSGKWAPARVEVFPGADGPVEAIVHGDQDWRTCPRLVVALHGGPQRSWTMKFHQLFQYLAAHGITVIAPNQRGSSGYGDRHRDAIRGAWAGPDLADILALGRFLREGRDAAAPVPMLYGHSYGAYLALVAAAAEPAAWARAVAVAPFLSGARLYPEASAEVRAMLDRLGAREDICDELGPRDLIRLARRIRARLLIVHGADDGTIPVGQSRALRDELLRLGRRESEDFVYREVSGAGHSPLDGSYQVHAEVASFLSGT